MNKQFTSLIIIALFLSLPFTIAQEREDLGEVININVNTYQPAVVPSNILAEQDVPVYAYLEGTTLGSLLLGNDAINIPPLYKLPKISRINAELKNPSNFVTTIQHKAPYKKIYSKDKDSIDLGYLIIRLRKIKKESEVPDVINLNLTAKINFELDESFGIFGTQDLILRESNDEENWKASRTEDSAFWSKKGYVRAYNIKSGKASFEVYDGSFDTLTTLSDKSTDFISNSIRFKTGDFEDTNLLDDRFRLKVQRISVPEPKAKLRIIDSTGRISDKIVTKGMPIVEGSSYRVKEIRPKRPTDKGQIEEIIIQKGREKQIYLRSLYQSTIFAPGKLTTVLTPPDTPEEPQTPEIKEQPEARILGLQPIINSVIFVESRGNPRAVSPTGPAGMMGLSIDAANEVRSLLGPNSEYPFIAYYPNDDKGRPICNSDNTNACRPESIDWRFNKDKNIAAGTQYLLKQINKYKDLRLALFAYNQGPGAADNRCSYDTTYDYDRCKDDDITSAGKKYVALILTALKERGGIVVDASKPVLLDETIVTVSTQTEVGSENPCANARILSDEEIRETSSNTDLFCTAISELQLLIENYPESPYVSSAYELLGDIYSKYLKSKLLARENYEKAELSASEIQKDSIEIKLKDLNKAIGESIDYGHAIIDDESLDVTLLRVIPKEDNAEASLRIDSINKLKKVNEFILKGADKDGVYQIHLIEIQSDYVRIIKTYSKEDNNNKADLPNPQRFTITTNNPIDDELVEDKEGNKFHIIELLETDTKEEAIVTILPGSGKETSTSDFSLHIPIEKRAIRFTPEEIDNKIARTKKLIEKLDSVIKKLDSTLKVWKTACLITFSVLTIKNSFFNPVKNLARRITMRGTDGQSGWYGKCKDMVNNNEKIPDTDKEYLSLGPTGGYDKCIEVNNNEIEKEIEAKEKSIIKTRDIVKKIGDIKNKESRIKLSEQIDSQLNEDQIKALYDLGELGNEEAQNLILLKNSELETDRLEYQNKINSYKETAEKEIKIKNTVISSGLQGEKAQQLELAIRETEFRGTKKAKELYESTTDLVKNYFEGRNEGDIDVKGVGGVYLQEGQPEDTPLREQKFYTFYQDVTSANSNILPAPPSTFIPSPNFNDRPRGIKPDAIVIHATAGDLQSSLSWLKNDIIPETDRVSAHYVIAKDGSIYNLVNDNYRAWHAEESSYNGRSGWNDFSIGIELVNANDGLDPYPQPQISSLISLLSHLVTKYSIKTENVVTHAQISLIGKFDPKGLDTGSIINTVYQSIPTQPKTLGATIQETGLTRLFIGETAATLNGQELFAQKDNNGNVLGYYVSGRGVSTDRCPRSQVYKGTPTIIYDDKGKPLIIPIQTPQVDNNYADYAEFTYESDTNQPTRYHLFNVGLDGIISEINKETSDDCEVSKNNNFDLKSDSQVTKTVSLAYEQALKGNQVVKEKGRSSKIKVLGKEYFVNTATNKIDERLGPQCTDVFSLEDCHIMFGVCDPVICPTSRFDFGNTWKVDNVVQTGIVGSILLGIKNLAPYEPVPICLTGVLAGLENIKSILQGLNECLQTAKVKGEYVGICDAVTSIYICETAWREGLALYRLKGKAINWISKDMLHQDPDGGEYLTFKNALKNVEDSAKFFTKDYAPATFKDYAGKSFDEVGSVICRQAVYSSTPGIGKFLDQVLEPDSPPQFTAILNVFPWATLPDERKVTQEQSRYQIYYHIFAGNNKPIRYSVILKDQYGRQIYVTENPETVRRIRNTLEAGDYADKTIDFVAAAGYDEVCIEVDGMERCGFGSVTSAFSFNFLKDELVKNELSKKITNEQECIVTNSALNPSISSVTNTQSRSSYGATYTGIRRECSLDNPAKGTTDAKHWEKIPGSDCGLDQRGRDIGYCWLYVNPEVLNLDYVQGNKALIQDLTGLPKEQVILLDDEKETKERLDTLSINERFNELVTLSCAQIETNRPDIIKKSNDLIRDSEEIMAKSMATDIIAELQFNIARIYVKLGECEYLKLQEKEAEELSTGISDVACTEEMALELKQEKEFRDYKIRVASIYAPEIKSNKLQPFDFEVEPFGSGGPQVPRDSKYDYTKCNVELDIIKDGKQIDCVPISSFQGFNLFRKALNVKGINKYSSCENLQIKLLECKSDNVKFEVRTKVLSNSDKNRIEKDIRDAIALENQNGNEIQITKIGYVEGSQKILLELSGSISLALRQKLDEIIQPCRLTIEISQVAVDYDAQIESQKSEIEQKIREVIKDEANLIEFELELRTSRTIVGAFAKLTTDKSIKAETLNKLDKLLETFGVKEFEFLTQDDSEIKTDFGSTDRCGEVNKQIIRTKKECHDAGNCYVGGKRNLLGFYECLKCNEIRVCSSLSKDKEQCTSACAGKIERGCLYSEIGPICIENV